MRSHPPGLVKPRPPVAESQPPIAEIQPAAVKSQPPISECQPAGPVSDAQRASSRPTASFGPARNIEQNFWEAAPGPTAPSLAPEAPRARRGSRGRRVFAACLFVMFFAGVATLLGLAIKKKLDAAPDANPASALMR
jgi:hypothetical protein